MPNASDDRAAARRLRRLGDQLMHDARALAAATEPARFADGPVRWALERASRDVSDSVRLAAVELGRLATICELRADARTGTAVDLLRDRGLASDTSGSSEARP